jgi:hypothetical protein
VVARAAADGASQLTERDADLREGPGAYYSVIGRVKRGTQVNVLESKGSWRSTRTPLYTGWAPVSAFEKPKAGLDYLGLADGEGGLVISSADVTAATKGALAARLAERQRVDLAAGDVLDTLSADAATIRRIEAELTDRPGFEVLAPMPRPDFRNSMILVGEAESVLGRALAVSLLTNGLVRDAKLVGYVNAVAALVGAKTERYDLPYRVAVVEDAGINGFGLPGGYIVVTRGLLGQVRDEAELACLLGHEMAHISRYHGLREYQKREVHRRADKIFGELDRATNRVDADRKVEEDLAAVMDESWLKIMGGRARGDELEADAFGAAYASAAGYDPSAAASLLERLQSQSAEGDVYRHHPSLSQRIAELKRAISRYKLIRGGLKRPTERIGLLAAGSSGR